MTMMFVFSGYTALHVACRQHGASNPRLHTVHVLLEHASADIWKGVRNTDSHLAQITYKQLSFFFVFILRSTKNYTQNKTNISQRIGPKSALSPVVHELDGKLEI